MRILLLSGATPNIERHGAYARVAPHMQAYASLCLAAVLEQRGQSEITIVDTEIRPLTHEQIIDKIQMLKPHFVGISVHSITRNNLAQLFKKIRKRFANIILVAGGPHVKLYPEDLVENNIVDYCCSGEADYAFADLVNALETNGNVEGIANLVYKRRNIVIHNPDRPLIDNLDVLPFPAFHLIRNDMKYYHPQPMVYKRRPWTILVTSRGCPYNCAFCPSRGMWKERRWRYNSPEYMVALVEHVVRNFGVRELCFNENSFTINRFRIMRFCELLIEKKLNIIWSANINLRNIDEEMVKLMRHSGCWLVSCGIETGSNTVMRHINKPLTLKEAEQKVNMLVLAGIKVRGYFMIGHVIDTMQTIRETIDFSKSLPFYSVNFSVFTPTPGSDLYDKLAIDNPEINEYDLATYITEEKKRFVPPGFHVQYLIRMQRRAFIEFFFRFSQIVFYVRSMESFEDLRRFTIMLFTGLILFLNVFRVWVVRLFKHLFTTEGETIRWVSKLKR